MKPRKKTKTLSRKKHLSIADAKRGETGKWQ